jgi:hypothetical protein
MVMPVQRIALLALGMLAAISFAIACSAKGNEPAAPIAAETKKPASLAPAAPTVDGIPVVQNALELARLPSNTMVRYKAVVKDVIYSRSLKRYVDFIPVPITIEILRSLPLDDSDWDKLVRFQPGQLIELSVTAVSSEGAMRRDFTDRADRFIQEGKAITVQGTVFGPHLSERAGRGGTTSWGVYIELSDSFLASAE